MFRSYFMATLRTLLKNRGLTAINILGLAMLGCKPKPTFFSKTYVWQTQRFSMCSPFHL